MFIKCSTTTSFANIYLTFYNKYTIYVNCMPNINLYITNLFTNSSKPNMTRTKSTKHIIAYVCYKTNLTLSNGVINVSNDQK